jgi:UDP-N-acetylmuramoylalanine--D-glutamate ligase
MTPQLERPDYASCHALVMGLGVNGGGAGVARFLAQRGARVTVTDLQSPERLAGSMAALKEYDVRFVLGEHREADFLQADFIVRNPAVPRTHPYLRLAESRHIPVHMEMTLFFLECPSRRVAAVTGTKGKTTTTTLLGELLKADGREVVVAGNLRVSALEQLERIRPHTDVVLELSSFQLEGLQDIAYSPPAALITNLMVDHLNRYASLADYFEAKKLIFRFQGPEGILALNRGDPHSRGLEAEAPGRVVWFGAEDDVPGAERCRLRGEHNRANLAGAAAQARPLGVADGIIARAVADFRGVPNRQELIRERHGGQFVNDSAATAWPAARWSSSPAARTRSCTSSAWAGKSALQGRRSRRWCSCTAPPPRAWRTSSAPKWSAATTTSARPSSAPPPWPRRGTPCSSPPPVPRSACSPTSSTAAISSTRSCAACS